MSCFDVALISLYLMGNSTSNRRRIHDSNVKSDMSGQPKTLHKHRDQETVSNSFRTNPKQLSVEDLDYETVFCSRRKNSKQSLQTVNDMADSNLNLYSDKNSILSGNSIVGDKLCHYSRDSTIPAYFEKQFLALSQKPKQLYREDMENNDENNDDSIGNSHRQEHLSTSEVMSLQTGEELDLMTVHELYNCLNDGTMNAYIMDPFYILLLDIRERSVYDVSHIVTAQPSDVIYTELVLLFNYGYIGGRTSLKDFTMVVIYGQGLCDLDDESCPEMKLYHELSEFGINPYILKGGFEAFHDKYPFLCSSIHITDENERKKYLQTYPSEIVEGRLYQGRGDQATNLEIVKNLKITHIVNVCTEHKNAFPEEVTYLHINVEDLKSSSLKVYFQRSCDFITNALNSEGCVLIHCNLGMSRSSTITLCYLMTTRQWSLKQAYEFMKSKRQAVKPNRSFLRQLCELEEEILDKKVTDPDDIWF